MSSSMFSWFVRSFSPKTRILTELQRCAGEDNLNLNLYPILLDTLLVILDGKTDTRLGSLFVL